MRRKVFTQVQTQLDPDEYEALNAVSKRTGLTVYALVKRAIMEMVGKFQSETSLESENVGGEK